MNFTVEVRSGLCNMLKSFVTALSIGEANVLPNHKIHFDADHSEILDSSLICKSPDEAGESVIGSRFLILKSEEEEQSDLINDAKNLGHHPDIINPKLIPLFSQNTIDWFYDRNLISDTVYNRIQAGIQKVKWRPEVLNEVDRIVSEFEGAVLCVQIRTWSHETDPSNVKAVYPTLKRTWNGSSWVDSYHEGVKRDYNFETYKNAIQEFLPKAKTVFLTADNDAVIDDYINYLKNYDVKIVTYPKPQNITQLQHSASTMLLGANSDMLVCSRLSTFAECMWWFGGCKAKVIPVF